MYRMQFDLHKICSKRSISFIFALSWIMKFASNSFRITGRLENSSKYFSELPVYRVMKTHPRNPFVTRVVSHDRKCVKYFSSSKSSFLKFFRNRFRECLRMRLGHNDNLFTHSRKSLFIILESQNKILSQFLKKRDEKRDENEDETFTDLVCDGGELSASQSFSGSPS